MIRIGFIGIGKVGKLLSEKMSNAGFTVLTDSSDIQHIADNCDILFITTPEHIIGNIVKQIKWSKNLSVVHCSGLTSIDVLDTAYKLGSSIGVFHPLHNFNSRSLEGASISIEADDELYEKLDQIAKAIKCSAIRIRPNSRELYHSAIPFTQDFVTVLMNYSIKIWESVGVNKDDAIDALTHLIKTNDHTSSIDIKAVEQHINALEKFDKEVASVYKQLTIQAIKNHN
jgi:predicted short-subunit dehydrogenase-like oxidoreductase (DUF2520 family)